MRRTTTTMFRIPPQYLPLYEQGKADARLAREAANSRTQILEAYEANKRAREKDRQIERTMQIAREWTALRQAARRSDSPVGASS